MGTALLLAACCLVSEVPTIKPEDAAKYMNKEVTVRLTVTHAVVSRKAGHAYLYWNDDESGRSLIIWVVRPAYSESLNTEEFIAAYEGKVVKVTGRIEPQNPKYLVPRMYITKLSQIAVVKGDE